MGLDITAHSRLREDGAITEEKWEDIDWHTETGGLLFYAYPSTVELTEENWPGQTVGIVGGMLYEIDGETLDFRAGSYSGYNWWRKELCKAMLGVEPAVVWRNEDKYSSMPFYRLINFSDAEGYIGSAVAVSLAKDFADHDQRASVWATDNDREDAWFYKQYQNWQRAFNLAADNGVVWFH